VFQALTQAQVHEICDLLMARIKAQLVEQQIELEMSAGAKDYLVDKGFDPTFGARPLRRTIQNLIEDPLAEGMLQGRFFPGCRIVVVQSEDGIELQAEDVPAPDPELTVAEAEG
jgi:ATP-dependent Clp protease ATP-binding subunit ClpC